MRGRSRNKGPNPLTRSYESNGPDVKVRGTAQTVADKYSQLARDALASGDPVMAENYFQHAEHYYRIIAAAQEQLRQQYGFPQRGYDEDGDEGDDDGDYRGGERLDDLDPAQQPQPSFGRGAPRDERGPREDRGPRDDRGPREDRGPRDDRGPRQERRDDRRERFQPRDRRDGRGPDGRGPDVRNQGFRGQDGRQPEGRGQQDFRAQEPRAQDPRSQEPRSQEPRHETYGHDGGEAPRYGEAREEARDEGRRDRPRRERRRPEAEDESPAQSLPAFVTRPSTAPAAPVADEAPAPKRTRKAAAPVAAEGEEEAKVGDKPRRRTTRRKVAEPGSGDAEAAE
ncbi:DUF4167 domain-containing protein [Salinarimonas chemoclinalis]|uniref:DUF4167 domain-containing protein n=1 Tax=Salinarimonas chemoclinalis TaxID=3241599 RepID=UPI003558EE91